MKDPKTGGRAFPLGANGGYNSGMTLRDYFAAKAMAAMLSSTVEEMSLLAIKMSESAPSGHIRRLTPC